MPYVDCMKTFLCILVVATFASGSVLAQTVAPTPPAPSVGPNDGEPIAPYDDKLLRVSEILGAIHYLRALCGAKEGNKWRDVMAKIVETEKPGPNRRARLIAHFNRGYRSFSSTYAECTPSALLASERYVKEGIALTNQITTRYGR